MKRLVDLFVSLMLLVLLSPVMAVIAIGVWFDLGAPVLFRQLRPGLHGEPFTLYKFRTMRGAHAGEPAADTDEERLTTFGRWLRTTSLDELPELWNVLRGDMSLVGPRPERPVFIRQFSKTIPNYMARHCVKSGITGWAQVNGWRGNTSLRKRVQYDLYYITHWTPWLDIRILWLTLFRGLRHPNAY